jgi:AcrR family transcriptional regulator
VLCGAIALADSHGIAALTIRSLAEALSVRPMAVYHYVANKGEILDAIVDTVFAEIDLPSPDGEWRAEIRRRAASARQVLRRHPWALGLLESRKTPGPANLRHHDAIVGVLRGAGFPVPLAAHVYALLDSYVYGFALQEATLPADQQDGIADLADSIMRSFPADEYPHLAEMATEYILQPGYDFGDSFEFGLNVILEAVDRLIPGR